MDYSLSIFRRFVEQFLRALIFANLLVQRERDLWRKPQLQSLRQLMPQVVTGMLEAGKRLGCVLSAAVRQHKDRRMSQIGRDVSAGDGQIGEPRVLRFESQEFANHAVNLFTHAILSPGHLRTTTADGRSITEVVRRSSPVIGHSSSAALSAYAFLAIEFDDIIGFEIRKVVQRNAELVALRNLFYIFGVTLE